MSLIYTLPDLLVQTIPNGNCLEWQGIFMGKGLAVPQAYYMGKAQGAHRVAYQLSGREIPKGKFLYRTCANSKCVNPRHLQVGTMRDVRALATANGKCYRGGATLTHCAKGHKWTDDDWLEHKSGKHKGLKNRHCKACGRARRQKGVASSATPPPAA